MWPRSEPPACEERDHLRSDFRVFVQRDNNRCSTSWVSILERKSGSTKFWVSSPEWQKTHRHLQKKLSSGKQTFTPRYLLHLLPGHICVFPILGPFGAPGDQHPPALCVQDCRNRFLLLSPLHCYQHNQWMKSLPADCSLNHRERNYHLFKPLPETLALFCIISIWLF